MEPYGPSFGIRNIHPYCIQTARFMEFGHTKHPDRKQTPSPMEPYGLHLAKQTIHPGHNKTPSLMEPLWSPMDPLWSPMERYGAPMDPDGSPMEPYGALWSPMELGGWIMGRFRGRRPFRQLICVNLATCHRDVMGGH